MNAWDLLLLEDDTKLYLYNAGDEKTAITGGYAVDTKKGTSTHYSFNETLSVTKNASNMVFSIINAGHLSDGISGVLVPANDIDFTEYSKLKILYDVSMPARTNSPFIQYFDVSIMNFSDTYFITNAVVNGRIKLQNTASMISLTDQLYELDISAVNGCYRFLIGCLVYDSNVKAPSITVKSIWLE